MGTRTRRWMAALAVATIGLASCSNNAGTKDKATTDTKAGQPAGDNELFDPAIINKAIHTGTPERGGEISYGLEGDILNISPSQSMIQPPDVQLGSAVYDPLVTFDDDGLAVVDNTDHRWNQLADKVEHTDDLKTWTVTLRDGVKFANGVDLTADQVVDQTEWVKAAGTCDCDPEAKNIEQITAPDDHTVVYQLKNAVVDWPTKLNRGGLAWITESGARGEAPDPENPDMDHLVGTGAFAFDSKSGDSYTVVANKYYYGVDHANGDAKLPYLDRITFTPLIDQRTRLQALTSGSVQILQTADGKNMAQAKENSKLVVQPIQGSSATIVGLNLDHPPFGVAPKPGESAQETAVRGLDDPMALAARQAYNYASNRNELNQKLFQGSRSPAYGLIPENSPWYDPDGQLPRPDKAKAESLVDKIKAAGIDTHVTLLCVNNSQANDLFALAQQQLDAVGFTATMRAVEQAVLVQNLLAGATDIKWEMACFRAPQLADPNGLTNALSTGGPTNFVKYSRKNIDDWLAEGRETTDTAERKKIYDQIQRQLAADVIYVPTLFDQYANITDKSVSGLSTPSASSLGIIRPGELYRTS